MAESRLDSKDLRVLVLWVLAGIVGVVFAAKYFFVAFPEASVDFRISRPAAVERGREFLAQQGLALDDYTSSIVFGVDNNAKTYLEREVGLEQANRMMASEVNVWSWRVRFFRPKQQEEFRVEVEPGGRVVGMRHEVEEARSGAWLEREPAHAIAAQFLREKLQIDLAAYDYLAEQANSRERPNRRDWTFTWERRGFKAKDAPYRLQVTLQGDQVGGYDEFLKVPEAWERNFERLRSSNLFYQIAAQVPFAFLLGAVIVALFDMTRRGVIRWRGVLLLGAVVAGLFFLMELNSWPLARSTYDTTADYTGFLLTYAFIALLASAGQSLLVVLPLGAGEPLYRQDHPEKMRLGISLRWPGLRSKEFFKSCVIGLAMAAAHLGFVVAFYVIGKAVSPDFWVPQDIKYTDAVSTVLPWIYPLAISLFAATSEEFLFRLFAIPFLLRMTKSKFLAIVIPAFVWGFLHSAYPVQPGWARGVEVGIIGLVAGWVMLRWGIWATLIWHYTVDAVLIGLFLLRSESLYFRLSGAVVGFLVVLPLVFAGVSYLVRRRFDDDESLLNRALPVEVGEIKRVARAAVTRVVEALSPRAIALCLGVAVAGAALAVSIEPKALGRFVKFSVTAPEASERSDAVLAERSPVGGSRLDPDSFRRATTIVSTFNGHAAEYLRRELKGVDAVNDFYEKKVPSTFWRTRYFRDSEKEEYHVILRPDGTLHAVHHLLDEKAPGATLAKEEAQARAQAYLRDVKQIDLTRWKLVEATSDKRDKRTDHKFVWEENEAVGEAHVRAEVNVLGDEISGYRVFVKIPEEWERKQEETSLAEYAFQGVRLLLIVAVVIAALVLFFRNLKEQPVPWRRMALWASAGGLASLASVPNSWPQSMANYPTEMPLRTFTAIVVLVQVLAVAFVFSAAFFLFGLGWFFLARRFGAERMPAWKGMPATYYRDALVLAITGAGALIGLNRLEVLLDRSWPTDASSLSALVPGGLDALWSSLAAISGTVSAALLRVAGLAVVCGLAACYLRQRWMQLALLLVAALAMPSGIAYPASFAKSALWGFLLLLVIWTGITQFFRFNLLGYFLTFASLLLLGQGVQLLQQEAPQFHLHGYIILGALAAMYAVPLLGWLRADASAAAPGAGPTS